MFKSILLVHQNFKCCSLISVTKKLLERLKTENMEKQYFWVVNENFSMK